MKKIVLSIVISLFLLFQAYSYAAVINNYTTPEMKVAITKYKKGNYTGCMQDCRYVLDRSENPLAYYYLGNCFIKLGRPDLASVFYRQIIKMNAGSILVEYSNKALKCINDPDSCKLDASNSSELDKFIASPPSDGLSPTVRKDFEQKHLDTIRNDINSDKDLDSYSFKKINYDNSIQDLSKIAQAKPTDAEVKAALKVLNDAGINPYDKQQVVSDTQNENTPEAILKQTSQDPELAQLSAFINGGNQSNNKNSMMDMLPYMMMQNKDGSSAYSPQMMQAVIMNSMMNDMNYSLDVNK